MNKIAIIDAFSGMPAHRRKQGTRHSLQLCLALFTLAVAAGNQGFLAIGDWLQSHNRELKKLFQLNVKPRTKRSFDTHADKSFVAKRDERRECASAAKQL